MGVVNLIFQKQGLFKLFIVICLVLTSTPLSIVVAEEPATIVDIKKGSLVLKSDGTIWALSHRIETEEGNASLVQIEGVDQVKAIAAGSVVSYYLKDDGTVWRIWGEDKIRIEGFEDIVAIDSGYWHVIALRNDGTVWTWGQNYHGQLGNGTPRSGFMQPDWETPVPQQVEGVSDVIQLASHTNGNLVLKKDGTVWGWGRYAEGESSTSDPLRPNQIIGLKDIKLIYSGGYHSYAVDNDGIVWAWGNNDYGQLGNGDYSGRNWRNSIPVTSPFKFSGVEQIETMALGEEHSLAVTTDGKLYAWGSNRLGALGDGNISLHEKVDGIWTVTKNHDQPTPIHIPLPSKVIKASAGFYTSLVLLEDGTLWKWGSVGLSEHPLASATPKQIIFKKPVQRPDDDIAVSLYGEYMIFDQPPTTIKGRTMVPLRSIFEAMGATLTWDQETKTITSQKGETTIILTVDQEMGLVNKNEVPLDQPATIVNGRTLVPVRFISEAMGASVEWDSQNKIVLITE